MYEDIFSVPIIQNAYKSKNHTEGSHLSCEG